MQNSDFLVICLALTPDTRHFINAEALANAKKSMVLINIGRGALIDENALISTLKEENIQGAALDVFTVEPLPESSELWELPNVLISPHNCDLTVNSRHKSVRFFTENCARFLRREELQCVVNKKVGY
jgi:phosphoglycerate dehydrogenase-like enzyme